MSSVADIVNRALDAAGSVETVGDIEDGTNVAEVARRHYMPTLRQLSRAAHWNCLRKQAPLLLLADATGQTQNVGSVVPAPWTYEYALPTDCMKARFVPQNGGYLAGQAPAGNIAIPATPLMPGLGQPPVNGLKLIPTRFLVGTDSNYPVQVNPNAPQDQQPWNNDVQGVSPTDRTVVLSNVKAATLVYTGLLVYPTLWDSLFEEAFVAALAAAMALPLSKADKKLGLAMRQQNIAIAVQKVTEARVRDGDEGFFNSDSTASWIKVRRGGWWNWNWSALGFADGPGVWGYGWDSFGGNSSAY